MMIRGALGIGNATKNRPPSSITDDMFPRPKPIMSIAERIIETANALTNVIVFLVKSLMFPIIKYRKVHQYILLSLNDKKEEEMGPKG